MLPDSIDPANARHPTNDSERLFFRELFPTLIRLDCQGQPRPGLAARWTSDSSRRFWIFEFSEDARESPAPTLAQRLASSWQTQPDILEALGIDSVRATDDGHLVVAMDSPRDTVPPVLAHAALGLVPDEPTAGWLRAPRRTRRPLVEFQRMAGEDPRDALDRGADLAVTRDLGLIDYATSRPEFTSFPLLWSRTYVLLQPVPANPLSSMIASDSVRRSLARDAVRAEARIAQPPFWWDSLPSCRSQSDRAPVAVISSRRVVYDEGDPVARGLAGRIVALAPTGTRLTAVALAAGQMAAALRDGTEHAYILALPRQTLTPCRELAGLPATASITPLIDTRARVIIRRGAAELTVDWDGTIRVEAP